MKIMKKLWLMLLMLAVIFVAVAVPEANAASGYTISLTDLDGNHVITAEPGDRVHLVISLENNPGIISVGVEMSYPDELSLPEEIYDEEWEEMVPQPILRQIRRANPTYITSENITDNPYLVWVNMPTGNTSKQLVTHTGELIDVYFDVAANAAAGDYTITLAAPGDKNLTANVGSDGKILPNTNVQISDIAVVNCTIRVEGEVAEAACGDNLTWSLDGETLTITGTGDMYDFETGGAPWYSQRESIKNVEIGSGVTKIGSFAFVDCSNISAVKIPSSVTEIGYAAFYGCSGLKSISIPEGVVTIGAAAFLSCYELENVEIAGSVTTIGERAFSHCGKITSVTIPANVTTIGAWAFYKCSLLSRITIGTGVTSIGNYAFYECDSLSDVYYNGTKSQWNTVEIGQYNEKLVNATLHTVIPGGTCGKNVTWTLDDEGTLTISGSGAMSDYAAAGVPWYSVKDSIKTVVIEEGVTAIGGRTFSESAVSAVTIPNSVTSIGRSAFENCGNLTSVTIPGSVNSIGVYAFSGCGSLGDVTISEGVGTIGRYAFSECGSLRNVVVPDSVTTIGERAFNKCGALTEVKIGMGVTTIDKYAFSGCALLSDVYYDGTQAQWDAITIGANNQQLTNATIHLVVETGTCGDNLFWTYESDGTLIISGTGNMFGYEAGDAPWYQYAKTLKKVVIEEGAETIGAYAFFRCSELESVTIPAGITTIDTYAFYECKSLTAVTIPDSVTAINSLAFVHCTGLTEIRIPYSVTTIQNFPFYGCSNLTGIWVDAENTKYSSDESGVLFNKEKTFLIQAPGSLSDYVIPDSVTSIATRAFAGCKNMTSVTIPVKVKMINAYAFYECVGLTDVYYAGSAAKWATVSIQKENDLLLNATIHTVEPTPEKLYVSQQPQKTTYLWGEQLDTTGMVLTLIYSDGSKKEITEGFTVTGFDSAVFGNQTLTVEFEGLSVNLLVKQLPGGTCGAALTWYVDAEGTLFVTGTGEMDDYAAGKAPWNSVRLTIKKLVVEHGVTSLGKYAFYNCKYLTEVVIADSVTTIAQRALSGCGITVLEIPNSVTTIGRYAFADSLELTSVSIPDSITTITEYAFNKCSALTEVKIGKGVTTIAAYAFNNCLELTDVYYAGSMTQWKAIDVKANNDALANANIHTAEPDPVALTVKYHPQKTTYLWGEELDITGLTLTVSYSDGTTEDISEGYTVTGYNADLCGVQTLTVTVGELTTTFTVEVLAGGTCGDNLTWILDADGVLTISGTGTMYDYTPAEVPWFSQKTNIKKLVIEDGVTTIGEYAFQNCKNLTEIVLSDSVTGIGRHALSYCGVTELVIPNSVTSIGIHAFSNCSQLVTVTISDSVTIIDDHAFYNCAALREVTIGFGIATIEKYAFHNCTALTDVYYYGTKIQWNSVNIKIYNEQLTNANLHLIEPDPVELSVSTEPKRTEYLWGEELDTTGMILTVLYSNGTTAEITEGFVVTGYSSTNYGIQTLTVEYAGVTATFTVEVLAGGSCGDNVYWLLDENCTLVISGTGAMYDFKWKETPWSDLDEIVWDIVIKDGVTTIGENAFTSFEKLRRVTIPESVTSIGAYAFSWCRNLTAVEIPYGVTSIGTGAFNWCENMSAVTIPDSVIFIGEGAFQDCANLSEVVIPNGITEINTRVFSGCCKLTSVTIPDSVTVIHDYAFSGSGLMDFVIPDSVVTIGAYAFSGCGNLTEVMIPESVTSIGESAFYGCGDLLSVWIPDSITEIGYGTFKDCGKLTEVSIGIGVTTIGDWAFTGTGLTDVYYAGSKAQWDKIVIGVQNSALLYANIHTVEPEPEPVPDVAGIFVSVMPGKTIYQWGETLDTTGMALTVMYMDGNFGVVTDGFTVTGFDPEKAGIQILMVTYENCTASFAVAVQKPQGSEISKQPVSLVLTAGNTAQFSVEAINAASYKWQYRRNEDAPWVNTTMSGYKTDTLSVQALVARNGYQYRCVVTGTDGKVHYSDAATLTVNESIIIIAQPRRQIADVKADAIFQVEAEGEGLTYQWLYRKNADDFWKVTGLTGNQTDTLTVPALLTRNGYQYCCAITDANGIKVYTNAATLSIIGFAQHPADQTVAVGTEVQFSVKAQGDGLTYRWQYRKSETGSWMSTSMTGYDTDTLTVAALASRNGYQYRCGITDANGVVRYSEPATLTVQ